MGLAAVVADDAPPQAKAAALRLFNHRRNHTCVPGDLCKILSYGPGRPLDIWLNTHKAHAADIVPKRLPFYVVFVGQPASISFEAQSELGVHYAVGRIAFDEPAAYTSYVDSVIRYETANDVQSTRDVIYWATRHQGDPATELSADCLATPLFAGWSSEDEDSEELGIAGQMLFRSVGLIGDNATRSELLGVLHGRQRWGSCRRFHRVAWFGMAMRAP